MNTNQQGNYGQGNRENQNPNQDSQRNQSGNDYAGNGSRRFSASEDLESDDQRQTGSLSGREDENRYNDDRDAEGQRMSQGDFNAGNTRHQQEEEDDLQMTGNSEDDRRLSDSRNYGADNSDGDDARYRAAPDDEDEDLDAADHDDTDDFDDEDDLTRDRNI